MHQMAAVVRKPSEDSLPRAPALLPGPGTTAGDAYAVLRQEASDTLPAKTDTVGMVTSRR